MRCPPFEGPFDAYRLAAEHCEVLFASYPAGTSIPPHTHETENYGVITEGELRPTEFFASLNRMILP